MSLLAFNSCKDNAAPEGETGDENAMGEGTYTVGTSSGEITSAYYSISEDGRCDIYLVLDGVDFSYRPPIKWFWFSHFVSRGSTELETGTFEYVDFEGASFDDSESATASNDPQTNFASCTVTISGSNDNYTITISGILVDNSAVSATYTGRFVECDSESGYALIGSGSYSTGEFSGSLKCAGACDDGYDDEEDYSTFYLEIVADGTDGYESNSFDFYLYFPGKVTELQPGTYRIGDGILDVSHFVYNDETGNGQSVNAETMTLEISRDGKNYRFKATGTLKNDWEVSLEFTGYVTYWTN